MIFFVDASSGASINNSRNIEVEKDETATIVRSKRSIIFPGKYFSSEFRSNTL